MRKARDYLVTGHTLSSGIQMFSGTILPVAQLSQSSSDRCQVASTGA